MHSQQNVTMGWSLCHYVKSQDSSSHSGFGYAESFAGLWQIHLPAFTEEISERMALDPHDYLFVFLI